MCYVHVMLVIGVDCQNCLCRVGCEVGVDGDRSEDFSLMVNVMCDGDDFVCEYFVGGFE